MPKEEVRHLGEKRHGAATEKKPETFERDYSRYDFKFPTDRYEYVLKPGLSREVIEEISSIKNEPKWMREFRLQAYEIFLKKPMPTWGADLSAINFDTITYYATPTDKSARSWDDVPEEVKKTFDRLGIPEAERKFLAGVGAQYDSEVLYHSIREDLAKKGVVFLSMDEGLKEYPDLVKEYFGTVIPPTDNKFAALNSAVWSGGSFIYVPKGVQVDIPLQAYFRINAPQMGQFERTLIIADEGARVHYIEGCLPGGEQVSVGDRWVNIESLKPGDYVIADNGLKARVRATMVRPYRGEMLTIKPISPYNAFRLTPEHPVLVVRRANVLTKRRARNGWLPEVATEKLLAAQPEYVPAGELTVGDFLVFPKVQPEGHNPTYTPELLKLLGYYLAEGSAFVHKSLNMPVVSFSFGAHERETIAEVCKLIEWVMDKKPCVTEIPDKHAVNVIVYSQELMDLCVESCGKGAATKRLSAELMALPAEQLKPLLEAYFRGDGSVCDKGNSILYRAATASETLAQQLQELLARLGIYASIQVRRGGEDRIQGRTIHRQDQYIVAYTVDKRWSEIRQTERYFLVPIKEIERAPYEGFVFNLDVEGPNSYLVRGFAVHNCTAPIYSKESLHSAVVELIAKRGAHLRYTTLQNWSNDVYNLVTKRAIAYEDATVEWVDANIGCLTADTKVFLNPRGAVNITEIKPNDYVYALDLNAMEIVKRRVKGIVCTGVKPVFRLTTENYREIKATANHPFLALQQSGKHWKLVWKPLAHLQVGDYIALSQGLPDEGKPYRIAYQPWLKRTRVKPQLPRETSEDLMWLLGLYLGDGFIERGKNNIPRRVYFAVPEGDPARPKLTELLQKLFGVEWKPKGISVTVNSAVLADFLLSLGLSGTAREKRIPRWVFGLPRRQKLALIEGYLDADGHIRHHQGKDGKLYGQLTFVSCNRELIEDLKLLMISCGLNPLKISSYSRERVLLGQYKGTYTTHYLNLPYSDLERIREKSALRPSVEFVRVLSVESLGEEPVYDIEVEGAHNFVANGLIVHNSRVTMKYPAVYMLGKGAKADILSVAFAGKGQHQDTGGKAIHAAPYTTSTIVSKSVSKDGGRASYRGQLVVAKGAHHAKSNVRCDALLLDERSRSDTYPYIEIDEDQVTIGHEATVGKVGDDQIFYLMSRGLSESEALSMIVLGFMEPFTKTLPMEYAIEFNRLIQLEMEGSVG
ncbi:MAG: Fe-S cluster assembly protein SufB [Candidatus Bipolaricaulota bacterium]|nr:Fe-S cluster assembly protein SufB [Candidatus Bipolaricaulota bacterium]MCS7273941.1 Fe-S cluster assembly protein SufB [Candidatus Bipolaricaulota bacterium]MDW8110436.1 Fe-S cluster assembly protein SufB [Candidatus Bipolaricaulota bacterium]MDW8329863.1 Fe-S cluster assembly protein SufB [Candidatus Bipolaricaulota bacterium]